MKNICGRRINRAARRSPSFVGHFPSSRFVTCARASFTRIRKGRVYPARTGHEITQVFAGPSRYSNSKPSSRSCLRSSREVFPCNCPVAILCERHSGRVKRPKKNNDLDKILVFTRKEKPTNKHSTPPHMPSLSEVLQQHRSCSSALFAFPFVSLSLPPNLTLCRRQLQRKQLTGTIPDFRSFVNLTYM